MRIPERLRPWLLLGLLAIGVRFAALIWNTDRLFGDVNLFALVARDWIDHGTLNYPGKYDFSSTAPYLSLSSPAGQHPPAWPWLGGVLAQLLGTRDTYFTLQLWSLIGGLLVVAAGTRLAWVVAGRKAAIWCGCALALHPYLVDYSANGSPYLWLGLAALTIPLCALDRGMNAWMAGALAGLTAAIAASVHGAGIALVPLGLVGLVSTRQENRLRQVIAYVAIACLTLLPTCLWMHTHFGHWWHSTTTDYVLGKIGRIDRVDQPDGIRLINQPLRWSDYLALVPLAAKSNVDYALNLACELGWFGLIGLGSALIWLRGRSGSMKIWPVFLWVALGAGLPCWLWPSFKYRFLAGLLPLFVWLVALAAARSPRLPRWAVGAAGGILIFWTAQWAITGHPAKYYSFDLEHRHDYANMRIAAEALHGLPSAPVLSFSNNLDGGVEAAYWHEHDIIAARDFSDAMILRLARDFSAGYAFLEPSRRELIETHFPDARLIYASSQHLVYTLHPFAHD